MRAVGGAARRPALGPMPDPPWPLEGDALAEWKRYAPVLHADGRLTPSTAPALAIYCLAYARGRKAAEDLAEFGPTINTDLGGSKANPAAGFVKEAAATMLKVLASFGATPADSARIKLVEAAAPDALAELVNRRRSRA